MRDFLIVGAKLVCFFAFIGAVAVPFIIMGA